MLVDVVNAEYINEYKIKIKFEDGKEGLVDFKEYLGKKNIFSDLINVAFFKKFYVNNELGTICWPNGADIAPETLYLKLKR